MMTLGILNNCSENLFPQKEKKLKSDLENSMDFLKALKKLVESSETDALFSRAGS